jgi:hypothetical protein
MSGQFHVPAAFTPGKKVSLSLEQDMGEPRSILDTVAREMSQRLYRELNFGRPIVSQL